MSKRFAKLIIKRNPRNRRELTYALRSGVKGTGRVLYSVNSWDNPRATEQAETMIFAYANKHDIDVVLGEEE